MEYDAIIVGASFAGLSLASQLKGKILLLDRKEIGQGQTSACATYLSLLEKLGCLDSLEQIHPHIYLHTASKTIDYELPTPFCTFNYEKFCQTIARYLEVDFLKTKAKGVQENQVITEKGAFKTNIVVDCSGWGAVLARSRKPNFVKKRKMSFGIETVLDYRDQGLHFFAGPDVVKRGYGWVFPIGSSGSNVGVGSYIQESFITSKLRRFFQRYRYEGNELHGNFFPSAYRHPVLGNIFLVGDAAGHCLPATGEGIRTAVYFGEKAGQIIQQIIEGRISLKEGLASYEAFVEKRRSSFNKLRRFQLIFSALPNSWFTKVAKYYSRPEVWDRVMKKYTALADPEELIGPQLLTKKENKDKV